MKKALYRYEIFLLAIAVVGSWTSPLFATEHFWTPIYRGVDYTTGSIADTNYDGLRIDLFDPDIQFFTTPTGGSLETSARTTGEFRDEFDLQVAINASFFSPCCSGSHQDKNLLGLAVSNGSVVSPADGTNRSILISQANEASIVVSSNPNLTNVYTAVSGNATLVSNGANVGANNEQRARTTVGLSQDNRYLYMMTVDERRFFVTEGGLSYNEMADLLIDHGAFNAINLDGGGSTTMVRQNSNGSDSSTVLNTPRDGQRHLGNSIGVFAALLGTLAGDFDDDGDADGNDFLVWQRGQLSNPPSASHLAVWETDYGTMANPLSAASITIPEPAAATLLLIGIVTAAALHSPLRRYHVG